MPKRRRRRCPPSLLKQRPLDPATAGPGDRLDGGLIVKRRLGRGGSADTLLVEREASDEELVLKVALDDAQADRIRAEADVLRRLHHHNIVRFFEETLTSGRPAILMERAGERTLAQWIRGGDALSLDLMRRFGEHLLSAIEYLEQEGIAHRDVKPDNVGIAKVAGTGAYRLVLFDFSLSRAPTRHDRRRDPTLSRPVLAGSSAAEVGPPRRALCGGRDPARDADRHASALRRRPDRPAPDR